MLAASCLLDQPEVVAWNMCVLFVLFMWLFRVH